MKNKKLDSITEQIQALKSARKARLVKVGFIWDRKIHEKLMEMCAKRGVAASKVTEMLASDWIQKG